ncbi:hypothetical protein [Streptomyces tauricus]
MEVVCRDGSAAYAETIRRALPNAEQVSDAGVYDSACVT